MVLEYVTSVMIKEVSKEIQQQKLERLIEYSLVQVEAKEYVRQTQQRLIVGPLLAQLRSTYSRRGALEAHLLGLLEQLREWEEYAQGYGPVNLMALLRELRGHLRQLDLSQLSIRGAYLQGVEMQDASLAGSIRDTDLYRSLRCRLGGRYQSPGSVLGRRQSAGGSPGLEQGWSPLNLAWQAHMDTTFTLAFSPDERTLVTAGFDGTVKLWDLDQGALLWTGQHLDVVRAVVFSPTGHCSPVEPMMARSSSGSGLRHSQADIDGREWSRVLAGWSPDGRLLASGNIEGEFDSGRSKGAQPATCVQVFEWAYELGSRASLRPRWGLPGQWQLG